MTMLAGPPRVSGMWLSMRASVDAVAISPSASTRSKVPVGKKGSTTVKEPMKRRGIAYITESCSKMRAGSWNEQRNATLRLRTETASLMKTFGKPSWKSLRAMRARSVVRGHAHSTAVLAASCCA